MQEKNESLKDIFLEMLSFNLKFETANQQRMLVGLNPDEQTLAAKRQMKYGSKLLQLFFAYKKAKLAREGISWDSEVIGFDDISSLINKLLNTELPPGEKKRYQVVIQSLAHMTNLDIEVRSTTEGNHLSIAILDAIDDKMTYANAIKPSLCALKTKYPQFIDNVFWTAEAIQFDELSCMIFSFKIASALRQSANFHTLLESLANTDGQVNWSDFPPKFLKLCQSKTFLEGILLKAWFIGYAKLTCSCLESDELYEKFKALGLSEKALNQAYTMNLEEINRLAALPDIPIESLVVNQKGETLLAYYDKHALFKPDSSKPLGGAAQDLALHYAKDLVSALERITDDELQQILEGSTPFPLDTVKDESHLSNTG